MKQLMISQECIHVYSCQLLHNYMYTGVPNRWTGKWTGTVEWTMEYNRGTISSCVLVLFVPFQLCQTSNSLLYCSNGY